MFPFRPWYRSVISVLVIVLFLTETTGSPYFSGTTQNVVTVSPTPNQFPQYLRNTSGTYSSATSLGSQTSEVNITVGKVVAFNSGNTFNDWTLLNSSVHIYAAPVFAGGVTYNGSNGDEAGTSVTAINITTDGGTGVNAVVIGAPYANLHASDASCGQVNSGAVFIFFGHTPLNTSYNLNQANLTICGNETGMLFGWSVAGAVNMTGPGGAGIAIGSPGFTYCVGATTNLGTTSCSPTNAPHAGAVWAVDRAVLKTIYSNLKWKPGMHAVTDIGSVYASFLADLGAYSVLKGEELGYSVGAIENTTSAGVAHQGYDDILAGAPYLNDTKGTGVGEAYAWDLPSGSVVGFENPSNRTNSHYGWSVGNVSDPGGANRQDVVIGAPGSDTVYVYKGDYWSSKYGAYTGGTTIAEPVLYRIPGKPGTNFGWSVAGIDRPSGSTQSELAIGAPSESTSALLSLSNFTLAAFQTPGSSLASSPKNDGLYAYASTPFAATLNLTTTAAPTQFTAWTQSASGCFTTVTSPVAIAGTSSYKTTTGGCYQYDTPASVPTQGVIEAYVNLASGDCLGILGSDDGAHSITPMAGVVFTGGQIRYGTISDYAVQSFFRPIVYDYNTWYKIDMVYNNTDEQYDIWVNGVLEAENITYGTDFDTQASINDVEISTLGSAYYDGCYASTPTVAGYVDAITLQAYSTSKSNMGSGGVYISSMTKSPGTILNATITVNATLQARTSLQVELTSNGGVSWNPLPLDVLSGNLSFLYGGGTSFGYRLFFNSTDHRFSPYVYSVSMTIGYSVNSNVGVVTAYGRGQNLNDSQMFSDSTWWQFNAPGSSTSNSTGTSYVPYPPGNPSNYTVDSMGIPSDNGHLQLAMEEGFQENFETLQTTSSTGGNWTTSAFSGGATPTWTQSSTEHVASPYSGEYSVAAPGNGLVYERNLFEGEGGLVLTKGMISEDIYITGTSAAIGVFGVSAGKLYTVFQLTFDAGTVTITDGGSFNSLLSFHYKTNTWYWVVFTFDTAANSFSAYINATNGHLKSLASGYSVYNALSPEYLYLTDNATATTYYVDDMEVGRTPFNGSYTSATDAISGYVTGVRVFNNSTEFPGTKVEVEVSRNGGANWSAPLANGSFYSFTNGEPNGNLIRFRILLLGNSWWTPIVYDVNVVSYYVKPFVTISGVHAGDEFGYSLSSGGDMDSDSGMDLAVGAPGAQTAGVPTGQAYVFYGTGWTSGSTYTSASANVVYDGQNSGDDFGYSVYAGSFNTSAPFPPTQLLVGAPLWSNGCASSGTNCGRVYLFGSSPPTMEVQLGYTASPHAITFATAQVEVSQQGFQNLALTMSTTTIPIGATLYLNITNLQSSTSMWGSPILVVWVNSASYSVASFYYCGYYLHAP